MKKWVVSNSWIIYLFGLIIWIIGLNFLAFSFKYKNIAVASVLFILFNVLSLVLVSYFYFKEGLSYYEMAGMLLGILAIVLLELGE
jgi:multidrug transporter EmrE-like cation transporter